jgi:hypothetical protein
VATRAVPTQAAGQRVVGPVRLREAGMVVVRSHVPTVR